MFFLSFIPFMILVIILVRAEIRKDFGIIKIVKPVCSTWLVVYILLSLVFREPRPLLFGGILTAMLFCFGGDMTLMFQEKKKFFMIGLVLFLIGHIAYGLTFAVITGFSNMDLISAAVLAVLFAVLLLLFRSGSGSMLPAVIAYMIIISFMVNRAVATSYSGSFTMSRALCIITGSVLFYASDVILAWNKFYRPFKYHRISLLFYYSGQFLIISSLYLQA